MLEIVSAGSRERGDALRGLARALDEVAGADRDRLLAIVQRAVEPHATAQASPAERALAAAAECLAELAPSHGLDVLRRVALAAGAERDDVATRLLVQAARAPCFGSLPPRPAVEGQVALLATLAPVRAVGLWTWSPLDPIHLVAAAGDSAPSRRMREVARQVSVAPRASAAGRARILGVPVYRGDQVSGALVLLTLPGRQQLAAALARALARALAPVLERDALLDDRAELERTLVDAGERRLRRVGLDLHDGPLQSVAALASELKLLRSQVRERVEPPELGALLAGRIDDLAGRLAAIDSELRSLAESYEAPPVLRRSLRAGIERELESFGQATGVRVAFAHETAAEALSQSQRVALFRVVQEALSNVRAHSRAASVRVSLAAGGGYVRVEIEDDGVGFDVDAAIARAEESRRLGIAGMAERTRLIGGALSVTSRPGGPTRLTAVVPEWRPLSRGAEVEDEPDLVRAVTRRARTAAS